MALEAIYNNACELSGNLPRDSNENSLCIASSGNIFVIPLVTLRLLDFLMIHR